MAGSCVLRREYDLLLAGLEAPTREAHVPIDAGYVDRGCLAMIALWSDGEVLVYVDDVAVELLPFCRTRRHDQVHAWDHLVGLAADYTERTGWKWLRRYP